MKKKVLVCLLLIVHLGLIAQKTNRPNVVIIYADDLGIGDLSCYGATTVKTPNIDRLAKKGLRLNNAHCGAATCTPSRYGLLTGEYSWRRKGTDVATGDAPMIVTPERYTLPDLFKQAGYKTGGVGKWHLGLGKTGSQNWNGLMIPNLADIGFDYSYIMAATGDRVPCVYMENGRVVNLDPNDPIEVSYTTPFAGEPTGLKNPEMLKLKLHHGHDQALINGISRIGYMKGGKSALWQDETIADTLTKKAVTFIENNKKVPFFLYFATHDIHVPRTPHQRFVGKTDMGARGDAIAQLDWTVGEVLNTLDRLKLTKNTIVIFSSDNGPVINDGYADESAERLGTHTPWGKYRGGKYSSFEAATRVPTLVCYPKKIKAGQSDALISQLDLMRSFADLLGQSMPEGAAPDSEAQWAAWSGKDKKGKDYLVEVNVTRDLSIIAGEWKYIEPSKNTAFFTHTNTEIGNNPQPQLYNLNTDKGERINVATQNPEIVKQLHQKLQDIKTNKK
jgi:arylsulfatase A-like enzyme